MKEEDFFAARPQFSLNEKLIRSYAILSAIGVSLFFAAVYLLIWDLATPRSPVSTTFGDIVGLIVMAALVHLILLVPAWRCYTLRRWACRVTAWLMLLISFLVTGLPATPVTLFTIPLFLLCFSLSVLLLSSDWRNLNKGF